MASRCNVLSPLVYLICATLFSALPLCAHQQSDPQTHASFSLEDSPCLAASPKACLELALNDDGSLYDPELMREVAAAVKRENLQVTTVFPMHQGPTPGPKSNLCSEPPAYSCSLSIHGSDRTDKSRDAIVKHMQQLLEKLKAEIKTP